MVTGVRARRGDQLRVRYNLRALGHVAILGSGITVVDLNRFYRLTQPFQTPGAGQCGRRLGEVRGAGARVPGLRAGQPRFDGIAMTSAVVTHSKTGCVDGEPCRGDGFIDIYSPLAGLGAVHTRSTVEAPGGVNGGAFTAPPRARGAAARRLRRLHPARRRRQRPAARRRPRQRRRVDRPRHPRRPHGIFHLPTAAQAAKAVHGDLMFLSLGVAGRLRLRRLRPQRDDLAPRWLGAHRAPLRQGAQRLPPAGGRGARSALRRRYRRRLRQAGDRRLGPAGRQRRQGARRRAGAARHPRRTLVDQPARHRRDGHRPALQLGPRQGRHRRPLRQAAHALLRHLPAGGGDAATAPSRASSASPRARAARRADGGDAPRRRRRSGVSPTRRRRPRRSSCASRSPARWVPS